MFRDDGHIGEFVGYRKKTVEYIKKQKEHHEVKTFFDEYRMILNLYKIKYDEQYLFSD